jgi:hypothetical protein
MMNAVFALCMVAGVAIAWRSNPMYSLGRTVRFLAICGAALALYVGAILGVLAVTAGMNATISGAALGVTILAGTMFYIWAIVTASTPHPPPIPPGTKLVSVNRARVRPWLGRLGIGLGLFAALVAVLRGDARDFVLAAGGIVAALAIVMLFTLYVAALGMDRSLTSVETAPWTHWTYTPDAWAAWREVLVARTAAQPRSWIWSRDWKLLVVPVLVVGVVSVGWNAASVPVPWSIAFFVAIGAFMAAMIELTARFEARAPERLRRLLLNTRPETYAGEAGIFCDGVYVQWMTPSCYLTSATIDERAPRCIVLAFTQIVAGAAGTRHFQQSVLIPPDADADLRTLQTRLAARCPAATIALVPPGSDASGLPRSGVYTR